MMEKLKNGGMLNWREGEIEELKCRERRRDVETESQRDKEKESQRD
jgi:hypothetical protein